MTRVGSQFFPLILKLTGSASFTSTQNWKSSLKNDAKKPVEDKRVVTITTRCFQTWKKMVSTFQGDGFYQQMSGRHAKVTNEMRKPDLPATDCEVSQRNGIYHTLPPVKDSSSSY